MASSFPLHSTTVLCQIGHHSCMRDQVRARATQQYPQTSVPLKKMQQSDEPLHVDYGDMETAAHWLSPNYLDLQLRCAGLLTCEARSALQQHFQKARRHSESSCKSPKLVAAAPVVWDLSWERALLANAFVEDHASSFLEESFC